MRTKALFLLPLLAAALYGAPAIADSSVTKTVKHIAPGITLTQEVDTATPPAIINVLDVDMTARGVKVGVGIGQDQIYNTDKYHGREDVSQFVRRRHVLAAVNGDFFYFGKVPNGDPLGLAVTDGKLVSEPNTAARSVMGLDPGGKGVSFDIVRFAGAVQAPGGQQIAVNGVDRPAGSNETILFTPMYGQATTAPAGSTEVVITKANLPVRANKLMQGQVQQVVIGSATPTAIPADGFVLSGAPGASADFLSSQVHVGDKISVTLAVAPADSLDAAMQLASGSGANTTANKSAEYWAKTDEAISGGPRLVVNGQIAVDGTAEGFGAGFTDEVNPRTAVGTSKDGKHLLIVTVDGRQSISKGVILSDLAAIMLRYGVWNAMNLDGGGSTCMAVNGMIVNSPSGKGLERPVADMLMVDSDRPDFKTPLSYDVPAADASVVVPAAPIVVGSPVSLSIRVGNSTIAGTDPGILWQGMVNGGQGFVSQQGELMPLKAGTGTITALYKGQLVAGSVTVQPNGVSTPVYALHADLKPDPNGAPNRAVLTVRVLDQNGMPLANTPVNLTGTGCTLDKTQLTIDVDGTASTGVTWNGATGGSILVQSGTMTPVTITRPSG